MQKNILITGQPRSGKTTLLRKIINTIPQKVGFVTTEIRDETDRIGFEIETHTGEKTLLAHVDFPTPHKVSRYFVNVENLEAILPSVAHFEKDDLLYMDEVAQMELFSDKFKELVLKYLDSPNTCLILAHVLEDEFTKSVKAREDVIVVEITPENRDEQEKFIRELLSKIETKRKN